jgi:hypothetical protein
MPRQMLADGSRAGAAPWPSHPLSAFLVAQFLEALHD